MKLEWQAACLVRFTFPVSKPFCGGIGSWRSIIQGLRASTFYSVVLTSFSLCLHEVEPAEACYLCVAAKD